MRNTSYRDTYGEGITLKRIIVVVIAVTMIMGLFNILSVKADSTSLENKENFSITTSTYDQSLLDGSVTGYTLTAGDVLFISWKGNSSPFLSAPRVYLLTDYQFHGWDYFRKCIFQDPASRGWIMKKDSWEMTLNYSVTSSDTYYVIIDNPNWVPSILPQSIEIISYEAVQNYPNSYYLIVKTDPLGVTSISGDGWYLRGYDKILTAPSVVTVSPSLQYRFEYWDVDGVSYGRGVNPITVDINSNKTSTAHYVLYQLLEHKEPFLVQLSTHEQGLLVGSVDGYSLTVGDTLFVSWKGHTVSMGGILRFYLLNDYQFQGWTWNFYFGGDPTRGYLIRSDSWEHTVNYQVTSSDKYYVIIECVGIHHEIIPSEINVTSYDAFKFLPKMFYLSVKSDPVGIVSIDGEGWYAESSNPVLTAPTTASVSPEIRYKFEYWDVDEVSYGIGINPITVSMNENHTATAHYILQYQAAFNQMGLDSSAITTVVSVNGVPKMYSDLPYVFWIDRGRVITYVYNERVSSSTLGKSFVLENITGPASPIIITNPLMVTGNYKMVVRAQIPATMDIDPNTLNLQSKGEWITCYIELPEGYNVSDIDIYSIRLNNTFPMSLLPKPPVPVPTEIGDYDNDGIPDLMVKFNRTVLTSHIYHTLGITYGDVTLKITGNLTDGTLFEGKDTVKVIFGGDADLNGLIEMPDFYVWRENFGKTPEQCQPHMHPDFNNNEVVELLDFYIWRENFGATTPQQP